MQSTAAAQQQFKTIEDIILFLDKFNYSDMAMIEVVRNCYFTQREKRVFEYYPIYLEGKRQSDIGFLLNFSQGLVSTLFKQCKHKLQFFRDWVQEPAALFLEKAKAACTAKEYSVLNNLLAGRKMTDIAKEFKCTKINISLLCTHALRKLVKKEPTVYVWAKDLFLLTKTIKPTKR